MSAHAREPLSLAMVCGEGVQQWWWWHAAVVVVGKLVSSDVGGGGGGDDGGFWDKGNNRTALALRLPVR